MFVFFVLFACISFFSAFMILLTESVMHCAFWLLLSFVGIAGVYVLANADFLAVSQIVVYIGGVLILLLFGMMLTATKNNTQLSLLKRIMMLMRIENLLSFGLFLWVSFYILQEKKWQISPQNNGQTTVYMLGARLLTDHFLAFELVGVLLLVVLVGALVLLQKEANE